MEAKVDGVPNPVANPNSPAAEKCEECEESKWKYRCPGCGRRTCSLPCVQSHKRRLGCTGKRQCGDVIPLSQFDDGILLSDYRFLEEAKRTAESSHRLISKFGANFGNFLPTRLHYLRKAAYRRGTKLFYLPHGMSRREKNKSYFNQRANCIYWTIEWRFNSTNYIITDHEVDEHETPFALLEKHLTPGPWNDELTPFRNTPLLDIKLFIQTSAKVSKSPYRQLKIKASIVSQLKNVLLVEHPVIYVFLPSHPPDFTVEKPRESLTSTRKRPSVPQPGSPARKGTMFKEEEFEEGEVNNDEPMITDLKDPSTTVLTGKSPQQIGNITYCEHQDDVGSATPRLPAGEDLNFEQEVMDAYSEFVGAMDLDDFLCADLCAMDEVAAEEGLEEGEIASDLLI